jgi:aspartate/methionine/tyrosine aminotransferase
MISAAQAAHQFVTFATSTPMQVAIAHALNAHGARFFTQLRGEYAARRDLLVGVLERAGFEVAIPKGAYFVLARFGRIFEGDDVAFARHLVQHAKVAAIPPTSFYARAPEEGRRLIRFAFCKKEETLRAAAERLSSLSATRSART